MANPVRTCIGCEQTDDHPRHVVAHPDGSTVTWHMDCHAIASGCDVCRDQTAAANGVKGDELRAHLVTTGPSANMPGWTASIVEG
jgi:hypothetical protein